MYKPVRFQDSGPDVEKLQLALSKLGFSPGPIDGKFGFLTEEALVAFQRTYSLKPDAVAGAQVWQLLVSRELPILQFPQPLLGTQRELEAKFKLAPGTLSKVNRGGRRYRGQVLFIPQRKVLSLWDPGSSISDLGGEVTSIAIWGWRWDENLVWTGKEELASLCRLAKRPLLAGIKFGNWELPAGKKLSKRCQSLCRCLMRHNLQGILLELEEGQGSWRRRLVRFAQELEQELAKKGFSLYLKLPARLREEPTSDGNWSLDFRALGTVATAVVLDLSRGEEGLSFSNWVQSSLRYAQGVIPPWKILLLVPSSYSTGETKQLLSRQERERFAAMALTRRLGGIALGSGQVVPTEKYFVVERTREPDESYNGSQS
jgi:spore germination protein